MSYFANPQKIIKNISYCFTTLIKYQGEAGFSLQLKIGVEDNANQFAPTDALLLPFYIIRELVIREKTLLELLPDVRQHSVGSVDFVDFFEKSS